MCYYRYTQTVPLRHLAFVSSLLLKILENDRANDWEGSGANEGGVRLEDQPSEEKKSGCC